jgi:predicted ATP-dependent endonuclease of OLD family
MRLIKARVENYRSIIDTGVFEIEKLKTILVGPNESGKTILLQAIQQLNAPSEIDGFDVIRDYPRAHYNDISTKKVLPKNIRVVTGYFELEDEEKEEIPSEYHKCIFKKIKYLDNKTYNSLENAPDKLKLSDIKKNFLRMVSYMDKQYDKADGNEPSKAFNKLIEDIPASSILDKDISSKLLKFIESNISLVNEEDTKEEERYDELIRKLKLYEEREKVMKVLDNKIPVFILFNNYYKVKPNIHLEHLAIRTEKNLLDDKSYDYGNLCLLKLLGFSARELSNLGKAQCPDSKNKEAFKNYKDKLDTRSYQLNAASVKLTREIREVWNPSTNRPEADKLKIVADGQYLKVVVEDTIGVDIELDQRSEGFQWLVSFYIVFFAEAIDKHKNSILLLDEPGLSLHGLKQREFRETISKLAVKNQVIYSTHSPFLVGPDELDLVRVVELKDRDEGTKVHTTITSSDPAGLLPLQEALGYDLAQSLFSQQRNLILEGLTDFWYLEAVSQLFKNNDRDYINENIALVFGNSAGKVVYFATILHAHNLKVAALLDSDNAGNQAAQQESLVHTLKNKNILRTKDYVESINNAEIEDLLRSTLVKIVKVNYDVDLERLSKAQSTRPIVDIFKEKIIQKNQ